MNTISIGPRGSPLALAQAALTARALEARNPGLSVRTIAISTKGDVVADVPLHRIGAKGVFIKEIEEALLEGEVDIAVHSLKDLPCEQAPGLMIGACLPRENPGDVLISPKYGSLRELPAGALVGTGSRRRESQLLAFRPDLTISPLRGNIETRIKKAGETLDAVIIAAAGPLRLGLGGRVREYLPVGHFVPSPGQGIIAAQIREKDAATAALLGKINDPDAMLCYQAEREFLRETGGGCFLPVGALCARTAAGYALYGYIGAPDGRRTFSDRIEFAVFDPARGRELAAKLLAAGGREVLRELGDKEDRNYGRQG